MKACPACHLSLLILLLFYPGLDPSRLLLVHGSSTRSYYCEQEPCVFGMWDYFRRDGRSSTCEDVMFDNDFDGDCCSLKYDLALGQCALTVVGQCTVSMRPQQSCSLHREELDSGPSNLVCINNAAAFFFSVYNTPNTTNTTVCPASQYDPLGAPRGIRHDLPNNTMVLEGATDIVLDESRFGGWIFTTWQEITSNHITIFYENKGSAAVQDLVVEIHWRRRAAAPEIIGRVEFYLVAWYRGVDGAFRLDEPFLDDSLESYLATLRDAGGPFRAVTGVVISSTSAPPSTPTVTTAAVPTPTPAATVPTPWLPTTTAPARMPSMMDVPTVPITWRPPQVDSNVSRETIGSSSASRMVWFGRWLMMLLVAHNILWFTRETDTAL